MIYDCVLLAWMRVCESDDRSRVLIETGTTGFETVFCEQFDASNVYSKPGMPETRLRDASRNSANLSPTPEKSKRGQS